MTVAERCRELTDRFELPPRSAEKLNALLKFVITGPSSLTNVRDPAAAVELHIADSLAGLELPQIRTATTIADLGSGGGFPGLVLAIALPDAQLTLVESAACRHLASAGFNFDPARVCRATAARRRLARRLEGQPRR